MQKHAVMFSFNNAFQKYAFILIEPKDRTASYEANSVLALYFGRKWHTVCGGRIFSGEKQ